MNSTFVDITLTNFDQQCLANLTFNNYFTMILGALGSAIASPDKTEPTKTRR